MPETSTDAAPSPSEVRKWAHEQEGLTVGTRGALSADVVDAWNEAHPSRPYKR